MAYTPTNWETGDIITAVKLNNIESGIADCDTAITALKEEISELGGLSDDVKTALLQIAQKVAYIDDDGQDYYDALYNALYPPASLESISAVYTQSGTVYDTDTLDSLKADLVVTAHYDDSTTATVTTYTLSGTLTEGTSTITVSYGGKTTTFTVIVFWAFLWSPSDGDLSQLGWTETSTGGSADYDNTGMKLIVTGGNDVNHFIELDNSKAISVGSMEVTFQVHGTTMGTTYFAISDGTKGLRTRIQYTSGYKGIYTMDADAIADMTKLSDLAVDTDYTIKLEVNNGVGKAYVNGVLKQDNIDLTDIRNALMNLRRTNGTSNTLYTLVKSIKIYSGAVS